MCRKESDKILPSVIRLTSLMLLWMWAFWPEISTIASQGLKSSEWVHVLIGPVAIFLLIFLRRQSLASRINKGSVWGVVLLLLGVGLYAGTIWPFSYDYVGKISIVIVLAGIVLATCGWGVLKTSVPMLLITFLSIPLPSRLYATLIIRPETYTITGVTAVLNKLPGVDVFTKGVDMIFSFAQDTGIVAMGESNRGMRLLLAFGIVGVFIAFSRIRSVARLAVVAIAAIPVVFFCNFFRLFIWGIVAIYTGVGPTSALPRNVSMICSVLLLYGIFVSLCAVRMNLFVEDDKDKEPCCA